MKKNLKEEFGITLIALVITIIVLLILAGVSIAMLTGNNGILTQANNAKIKQSHAAVVEGISLAYNDWKIEVNTSNITKVATTELTSIPAKIMNVEEGTISDFWSFLLEKGYIDGSGKIDTEELTGTKQALGNGNNLEDVYMLVKDEDNYTLYYHDESGKKENLWSVEDGNTGSTGTTDTNNPNKATATIISTILGSNNSIVERINQTDSSGEIDFSKCKWVYNTESGEIGTDESKYTNTFTKQDEEITLTPSGTGVHYLHILTVDEAGNKTETVIRPVIIEVNPGTDASVQTESGEKITLSNGLTTVTEQDDGKTYILFNKMEGVDKYYTVTKNMGSMADMNKIFETEIDLINGTVTPDEEAISGGYDFSGSIDEYGIVHITPYSKSAVGPSV